MTASPVNSEHGERPLGTQPAANSRRIAVVARSLSGQFIQLGLRIAGLASSVAVVAILARYLGPSNYGTLAAGLTVASIIYALCDSGMYQVGVAALASRTPTLKQSTEIVEARLIMFIAVSPIAAAAIIIAYDRDQAMVLLICVGAAIPYAISAYRSVPESQVKPVITGLIMVSQNVTWLVIVVLGTYLGWSLEQLALGTVGAALAQAAVAWIVAYHMASNAIGSAPRVKAISLIRQSFPLICSALVVTAFYRGHQLLVFSMTGPEESANYMAAMRVLDAAQVLPATMASVFLPQLAKIFAGRGLNSHLGWLAIRRAYGLACAALIIALGVAFAAKPIVHLLLGDEYATASGYLSALFLAFPLISLSYMLTAALIATGNRGKAAVSSIAGSIFGLIAMVPAVQFWGATGGAYLLISAEAIIVVSLTFSLWKSTDWSKK